jgi:hypothetical protein
MRVDLPETGFESIAWELQNDIYVPEHTRSVGLTTPETHRGAYLECLDDINQSFGVAADPETGLKFEVAAVNLQALRKARAMGKEEEINVVVFHSTDFSSLTQNIGNAIELAGMGAANPNTCYIYVAYPGNGRSQNLKGDDRKIFKKTGRLTTGSILDGTEYKAVPHAQAMSRAVEEHFDLEAGHVSSNRSGGKMSLAHMAAARENSIKDAYLNGLQGVSKDAEYGDLDLFVEQTQSRVDRRVHSEYEPGKVTPETIREAKPRLPRIFEADDHKKVLYGTYGRAAGWGLLPRGNFMMNRRALSGHDDLNDLQNHALFQDAMAALMRQEALITLQANLESPGHNIEECIKLGSAIMNHIPANMRSDRRGIEFYIGTGKLEAHTDNPASRLGAERSAFRGSVVRFMRLVFSNSPDSMIVTTEEVLSEAA